MRILGSCSLAAALFALAGGAQAQIYRCSAAGAVTYQEIACPAISNGGDAGIPTNFPEANIAERERILRREAALDERLMKRAEIDAAERIARDNRLAREAALKAALERESAESPAVYVVARPARAQRHTPRRPWPLAIR